MRRALALTGLGLVCCSGVQIRGGHVEEPKGAVVTEGRAIEVTDCVDEKGRPVAAMSRLRLQRRAGKSRIVELAAGFDALVVTSSGDVGGKRVFHVVLDPSGGEAQLRQYAIPRAHALDPASTAPFEGELLVATAWSRSFSLKGLKREPTTVARRCRLLLALPRSAAATVP